MRAPARLLAAAFLLLPLAAAQSAPPPCGGGLSSKSESVGVHGRPFEPVFSADGCAVFVSLTPQGAVAILHRHGNSFRFDRAVAVGGSPTGMVLTHDGATLIAADAKAGEVDLIPARDLLSSKTPAVIRLGGGRLLGAVYVNVSPDGRFLFVSDESGAAVSVIDLRSRRLIGDIPAGLAPIALTFSPDGQWLYMTSEVAPPTLHWPNACARQALAGRGGPPVMPRGMVVVAATAKAETDPAHAIVASVPAGCSPVRLALSPDGATAYVTARTDGRILAFDTARLVRGDRNAQTGSVAVGTAPVGIAVSPDGVWIIATDSNRFAGPNAGGSWLEAVEASSFVPGARVRKKEFPAGQFPRELRWSPDGAVLAVTNFLSGQVEFLDAARAFPPAAKPVPARR